MSSPLLIPSAHPLDPERHGSKAARLARVADLGARVPPGLVIPAQVHAAALNDAAVGPPRVSPALAAALREGLAGLEPAPWVVRTSASAEDLPRASAAGIYRSELGCKSAAGVVAAVERCWQAAHAERVAMYLATTGWGDAPLPAVAILIQPQVRARWAGVLFTRDPRQGPHSQRLLCELVKGSTSAVTAGLMDPTAHALDRRGPCAPPLPADAGVSARSLVALADLAEQAASGPADVELALTGTGVVVLQLRPITCFGTAPAEGPDEVGLDWRWDAEHNPAPLSPLHASLVARLDRIPTLPFRMRCVGGLLYTAGRPGADVPLAESAKQIQKAWPKRRQELEDRLANLAELNACDAPLTALLTAFDGFYERYAALAGAPFARSHRRLAERLDDALARGDLAREQLSDALGGVTTPLTAALMTLAASAAEHPGLLVPLAEGRDVSAEPGGAAVESGLAAVIQRLGALPPVWDVAVPTLAESPAALRRAVAALANNQAHSAASSPEPPAQPDRPTAPMTIASHLLNLAADEEDDLIFARGLATLRTALLRAGSALAEAGRLDHPEHVFRLELPPLLRALDSEPDQSNAADLREWLTPVSVPTPRGTSSQSSLARGPLQGLGSGAGVVRAPALVIHRLDERLDDLVGAAQGRIIVCASLLPSAVVLLAGAAGIVTDHGGLLSHGAILARELGLPAVLATHDATKQINTDDLLWLDADQGLVIRLTIDQ